MCCLVLLKAVSKPYFAAQHMAVAKVFGAGADAYFAVQRILRVFAVVIGAANSQTQPGGVVFIGIVVTGDHDVGAVVEFVVDVEQAIGFDVAVVVVTLFFKAFFVVYRYAQPALQAVGTAAFNIDAIDVAEVVKVGIAVDQLHLRCPRPVGFVHGQPASCFDA